MLTIWLITNSFNQTVGPWERHPNPAIVCSTLFDTDLWPLSLWKLVTTFICLHLFSKWRHDVLRKKLAIGPWVKIVFMAKRHVHVARNRPVKQGRPAGHSRTHTEGALFVLLSFSHISCCRCVIDRFLLIPPVSNKTEKSPLTNLLKLPTPLSPSVSGLGVKVTLPKNIYYTEIGWDLNIICGHLLAHSPWAKFWIPLRLEKVVYWIKPLS